MNLIDSYIDKQRRDELFNELNDAKEIASGKIEERKEEGKRKHDEYQERLISNIEKLESVKERKEEKIENLESQIEELNSKEIWSDSYQEKVNDWISDKEEKSQELCSSIEDIEEKLSDMRNKLD